MKLKLSLEDYDKLVTRLDDGTGGNKITIKKKILNDLIEDYINLANELERLDKRHSLV